MGNGIKYLPKILPDKQKWLKHEEEADKRKERRDRLMKGKVLYHRDSSKKDSMSV